MRTFLFSAIALVAVPQAVFALPQYRVEPLVPPGSDFLVRALAGGYAVGNQNGAPLLVSPDGTTKALSGPDGYSFVSALGVNRLGTVVGAGGAGRGAPQGMMWRGDVGEVLPTDNGVDALAGSSANAINDAGTIVGIAETSYGRIGVVWEGEGFRLLKGVDPDAFDQATQASAINAPGQVAGWTRVGDGRQAAVWTGDTARLLGGFAQGSEARDLNDSGVTVGYGINADDSISAFVDDGRSTTALPTLNGLLYGDATAINNAGLVVGSSSTFDGVYTATVWQNGAAYDLNSLLGTSGVGWTLTSAVDVDDDGTIVGFAEYNGQSAMFRASPVPEPATLFALAGGVVAFVRRRR